MNDPFFQILFAAALAFPLSRLGMQIMGKVRALRAHVGVRRQGPCVPYDEARAADMIEPGIAPIVHALNGVDGVETLASCEAHVLRPPPAAIVEGLPYVMFRAPVGFVQALDAWVSLGSTRHPDATHYHWELTAHFRPPGPPGEADNHPARPTSELVWTIRTSDARIPDEFDRKLVDSDVGQIAAAVRRIAALVAEQQSEVNAT